MAINTLNFHLPSLFHPSPQNPFLVFSPFPSFPLPLSFISSPSSHPIFQPRNFKLSLTFLLFAVVSLFGFNDLGRVGLRGFLAGAIYGFHYVFKRRWVLEFPIIQRPPFYNFKMGIPLAAKRAFKLSIVAFIFSAILLEIIPHPFKCSIATKKFVAEQIVFFVASFAVFFCWELTHNLHRSKMEKSVSMAETNGMKIKVRNNLHVHDDLALFILSKLPLKSLKRFGCVRKSWSLLFENPHFMNMLRTHFSSRSSSDHGGGDTFLFLPEPEPTETNEYHYHDRFYLLPDERFETRIKFDLPPPFHEDEIPVSLLGTISINGFFCIGQVKLRGMVKTFRAVLWNPVTMESVAIPPSPDESVPPYRDPFFIFHGFGYDHVRDDYKVIRYITFFPTTDEDEDVPWEDRSYDPLLEIYSLRSNSWRILEIEKYYMLDCYYDGPRADSGVYMNGACHWWGSNDLYNKTGCLVSFDMSNEVLSTTPMPSDNNESFDFIVIQRHLMLLNESIALISNCNNTTTFHISILVELGVKESWIKLCVIGPMPPIECPIGVGKKGCICFKRKDGELVWIDLSSQIIGEIGVKLEMYSCEMGIYQESVLPIGGINS